jgi:hypothetical protein
MASKGWRRVWRWTARIGLVAALAAPLVLAGLWLAVRHIPGWYRPPRLEGVELRRAQMDATDTFEWISARMVAGQPFDVVLRNESINEWLVAAPAAWLDVPGALPPEIRGVAVRLREGGLSLGIQYADERFEAIVSLDAGLRLTEDGRSLVIRPDGVRVGAVQVPFALITALAGPIVGPLDTAELERAGYRTPDGSIARLEDFAKGLVFDNAFVWPNGDRAFRIESLGIDEGAARIRVVPEAR